MDSPDFEISDFKKDENGALFLSVSDVKKNSLIDVDERFFADIALTARKSGFYPVAMRTENGNSGIEWVAKLNTSISNSRGAKDQQGMIAYLSVLAQQGLVKRTDLPIAYVTSGFGYNDYRGEVFRYYPRGIALYQIMAQRKIDSIKNYYRHDDDSEINLLLLIREYVKNLLELWQCGIIYFDFNEGNIIIDENKVKIIDWDNNYVFWDNNWTPKDEKEKAIKLVSFIEKVLYHYHLTYEEGVFDRSSIRDLVDVLVAIDELIEKTKSKRKSQTEGPEFDNQGSSRDSFNNH